MIKQPSICMMNNRCYVSHNFKMVSQFKEKLGIYQLIIHFASAIVTANPGLLYQAMPNSSVITMQTENANVFYDESGKALNVYLLTAS